MNKKKAKLIFKHNFFEIVEEGDHVLCAVSGKEIKLQNLNYKSFTTFNKSLIRPKDFLTKKSEFKHCLKRNGIKRKSKI